MTVHAVHARSQRGSCMGGCLLTHCQALVGDGLNVYPATYRLQQRPEAVHTHGTSCSAAASTVGLLAAAASRRRYSITLQKIDCAHPEFRLLLLNLKLDQIVEKARKEKRKRGDYRRYAFSHAHTWAVLLQQAF